MEQKQFIVTEPVKFTIEYDSEGQHHTLTGEGFLELKTDYVQESDFTWTSSPLLKRHESTLTVSNVERYYYVKKEIKGVERTARVHVPALTEETIAHARNLAGVRTDTEFSVEKHNNHVTSRSDGFDLIFRWSE